MALPQSSVPNRPVTPPKPKVLLVDDHPSLLKSVSRLLAFDFEVVGAASDGRQALDASEQVDPDVIVLDVTMPDLDGFATARELKRRGTRAAILYLTMQQSEEFVAEGFRSGGNGYVLKTRLHADLMHAMDHVLAGQAFLPSLNSLLAVRDGRAGHAAQFYADERTLIDGMGEFLHLALRRGDTVGVIFPEPIRVGLVERLRAHGWNVSERGTQGRFFALDSETALASILRNGNVDPGRVAEAIDDMERLRAATAEGPDRQLTVVGQLAIPLLARGDAEGALATERLWNEGTRSLPFLTVCSYPMTCFPDRMYAEVFRDTCAEHWGVTYTPDSRIAATV